MTDALRTAKFQEAIAAFEHIAEAMPHDDPMRAVPHAQRGLAALRAALAAQPQGEPIGYVNADALKALSDHGWIPLWSPTAVPGYKETAPLYAAPQPQGEPAKRCAWPDCPHGADCVHAVAAPAPQPQGEQPKPGCRECQQWRNSKADAAQWGADVAQGRALIQQGAQRVAQPLTDEQVDRIADGPAGHDRYTFARAIERAHGIGEQA